MFVLLLFFRIFYSLQNYLSDLSDLSGLFRTFAFSM